jgi:oxygen-independent coproporphyrinogen-3 oxidase
LLLRVGRGGSTIFHAAWWDNRKVQNFLMPLGIYISVPFCRSKCSYCNFASGVFSRAVFERYIDRVCGDIQRAREAALQAGQVMAPTADSIYLGGGTPTLLDGNLLERLLLAIRQNFKVQADAEVTVECAPGTLTASVLEIFRRCGVNRVSLGVQSFVDREAAAVGRLHRRDTVLSDLERLRRAGISNISIDLIAGLPHQTEESWEQSLSEVIASGVPHVSVYMLEVDEDSRLGRELMAGGTKYHAHFAPDDELTAQMYEQACGRLNAGLVFQYEISNFGRVGFESRHNLKYWTRQPYLGFGVDAHSMILDLPEQIEAIRRATPDSLEKYTAGADSIQARVSRREALEEEFFLGLRLTRGVDLRTLAKKFGDAAMADSLRVVPELVADGLLSRDASQIRLTRRGRLLSNEVFTRFMAVS